MNRRIMLSFLIPALVLVSSTSARIDARSPGSETIRKVYVSATDATGAPVTDLAASEVTVKEGGKDRSVTSLQPAAGPMQIAIIVDDSGRGAFQAPIAQFLQKLIGRAQFAISVLNPKAVQLVDFTDNVEALRGALGQLGTRARVQVDGDQLPDAIILAAKALQQRKAERPVIVVFTVAGAEPQVVDPKHVLSTLRSSGASLNVVSGTGANLGEIMADGPGQSGGRTEQAGTGPAMTPAAVKIADALLSQYVLTYTLPDGVKMSDRLAVTTSRKGVTLAAPTRIPDK